MKINMPENVKMILRRLSQKGYEAVIIGGCVRDCLMGEEPHDWDIATSAQPEEIKECFGEYRIMEAGIKHGTVTIIIDHNPYEITTYRIDGKYTDSRRPDSVEFTSDLEKDVMRRDFSINAIAYDGKDIIDLCGGIEDLKNNVIRCVGDPNERFLEDPLRILRAIRFAARFGFEIQSETKNAMFNNSAMLNKVAVERKQGEFTKAICGKNIEILKECKPILRLVMPQIDKIVDFDKTVDLIYDLDNLYEKLAILVDNIGLYDYTKICDLLLTEMKYPKKTVNIIFNILTGSRMKIFNSEICVKKLMSKYSTDEVGYILKYKYTKIKDKITDADKERFRRDYNEMVKYVNVLNNDKNNVCYNLKSLNINGRDLKNIGIKDIKIKECLNLLLDLVIANQITNSKEDLIYVAKITML